MQNDTHLKELQERINKITQTPYIDKKAIDKVVNAFEGFVNMAEIGEMVAVGDRLAIDDYAREYMEEHGLTCPKDEDEALDRLMVATGADLARIHRTLQQYFMRVVLTFIETQAASYEAGVFDLRNEDTGRICKVMWDAIKDRDDFYLRRV